MNEKVKIDLSKDIGSVKFEFDPLEGLHNHVKEVTEKFTKRILNRYCAVCFFGIVDDNNLMGIPVCGNCINKLFPDGVEKATNKELVLFHNMAMLGRDARESLYMQLMPVDETKSG